MILVIIVYFLIVGIPTYLYLLTCLIFRNGQAGVNTPWRTMSTIYLYRYINFWATFGSKALMLTDSQDGNYSLIRIIVYYCD